LASAYAAGVERPISPAETWDEFFDDFYLRAYADDERDAEAGAQALAAARLARCPQGGELLDVPCGYGRHAIPLARAGYRVTAVDRSSVLLAEAAQRAQGGPEFVRGDYRELPFEDERFDAALNLYTSLGYLGDEEDTRVLAEIRRVLREGGRLVIEMMHRDRLIGMAADRYWRLMGEGRLLFEQSTFDPASGVAQTSHTLIEGDGRRESRTFSVRVYTATELLAMIERAGFSDARAYGGFEAEPLAPSTRLVIAAVR
jgi:ubiquinone/menaquinone biosynthesis C-methylase UbiE